MDGKTNEITAFAPLLDTLTGLDLAGLVITADALHTQREHVAVPARPRRALGADGQGQPAPAASPARRAVLARGRGRPTAASRPATAAARSAPSRSSPSPRESRSRTPRRPSSSPAGPARSPPAPGARKWRTETVYAITDLRPHQARPDELAAWIRGHWQIENGLHWVRDVTFAEDLSQVRTGSSPTGHGLIPQPRDQPAPAGRRHQHRRRATTSLPQQPPDQPNYS